MSRDGCTCWGLPGAPCKVHGDPVPGVPPPHVRYATEAEWHASRVIPKSSIVQYGPEIEGYEHYGHGCGADPAVQLARKRVRSLSERLAARLSTDHLSTGMGDHRYLWRSSLAPHQLFQFERWPGHAYWVERQPNGNWRRAGRQAVRALDGERFIRVGQVI